MLLEYLWYRVLTGTTRQMLPADGEQMDPAVFHPGDRHVSQLMYPAHPHRYQDKIAVIYVYVGIQLSKSHIFC